MTSEQTDALQALKDKSLAYLQAAASFGHACGQDYPDVTARVEAAAQSVSDAVSAAVALR